MPNRLQSRTTRIAIIGCGDVGSTLGYVLLQRQLVPDLEVMLFNRSPERALGCALDLNQAAAFDPNISFSAHSFQNLELCREAAIIVITIGKGLGGGIRDRNQLAAENGRILLSVLERIGRCKDSIILLITNPVDNMCYLACKYLERHSFPHKKVFGLGTAVETARFVSSLGLGLRRNPDVLRRTAFVLGEHGKSMVPIVSLLGDDIIDDALDIKYIVEHSAMFIRDTTGNGPKYSIALCAWELLQRMLSVGSTENDFSTVSTYVKDSRHYGVKDVCISLPVVLDRSGVKSILNIPISKSEKKQLRESACLLQGELQQLKAALQREKGVCELVSSLIR